MKTIDLVYILGTGSKWKDNEIRFSLRSVEKNLLGVRKIFVIGEKPSFFTDKVIHIQYPDFLSSDNADGNMTLKILRACEEKGLSDDFLFMNDDFIVNKRMIASEIPWMHKGNFNTRPAFFWTQKLYRFRLKKTFDILREKGYTTLQYDYHAPMLMNKKHFPEVMSEFDFQSDIGYTFRSLYGNVMQLPAEPVNGRKITVYKSYSLKELRPKLENALFVGYNDKGLNPSFKWWLTENFPEKSKYESGSVDDRYVELFYWKQNGQKYDEAVNIFEKYFPHHNLLRLFKSGETKALSTKINYKFFLTIKDL